MGTDDRNNLNGEQPRATALDSLNPDVDMDPEMTRIMSETQEAAEAIRQSFLSASRAREETISEAQTEADGIRDAAEGILADARTESDRLIADTEAEIRARVEEAEKRAALQLAQASDQADALLQEARAEHAALSETATRLRVAVKEMETFIEAFKHAARRFEDATGNMMIPDEADTIRPASLADGNGTVARDEIADPPPENAERSKQAAIEALSSLATLSGFGDARGADIKAPTPLNGC